MDVQRPPRGREPQDQTARAVLVVRIVLNELPCRDGLANLLDSNAANDGLVRCMLGDSNIPAPTLSCIPERMAFLRSVATSQAPHVAEAVLLQDAIRLEMLEVGEQRPSGTAGRSRRVRPFFATLSSASVSCIL